MGDRGKRPYSGTTGGGDTMTSKERVGRALRKLPTDRVPIFMWFHPRTREKLSDYLGVPEMSLDEVMGNDVKQTWVNDNYAMEGIIHDDDAGGYILAASHTVPPETPLENIFALYDAAGLSKEEIEDRAATWERPG